MSAVSRKLTPSSKARLIVASDSFSSPAPYAKLIPIQPSPMADTSNSLPNLRFFIALTSNGTGGHPFKIGIGAKLSRWRDIFLYLFKFCLDGKDRILTKRQTQGRIC